MTAITTAGSEKPNLVVAFLGFTLLLTAFFKPLASLLFLILYGVINLAVGPSGGAGKSLVILCAQFLSYAPAAVASLWFFRVARLRDRLPARVPGSGWLLAGVAVLAVLVAYQVLLSGMLALPGSGASFGPRSMLSGGIIMQAAHVAMLIGAIKLLLSARPTGGVV